MRDSDKKEFAELVRATLKMYRAEADAEVLRLWWAILCRHEIGVVSAGFSAFLSDKKSKFQPVPADIIEFIERLVPDGRLGADEAWAMIPRDEHASAVMTEEMAEAMGAAQPLLDEGDQVAARMAFKEAYVRIVENNKLSGIAPKWFPSLGRDPAMREAVMNDAVRRGRLGLDHAAKSVPAIADRTQNRRLAIEDKAPVSNAKALENLAKIRQMLGGSRLAGGQA